MKVYAELIQENNITYQKTTILKFGNSWDLIGSAVLKNPGSASPINAVGDETLKQLININNKVKKENWFEFTNDPTMIYLEKIFNGDYIEDKKELNGIILLFNLYYIKDQDIVNARRLVENNNSENLFPNAEEIIPYFQNKPVFLGWRYEYLNYNRTFAHKIFDYVKASKYMYLKNDMIENQFYHPVYIQSNSRFEDIQKSLKSFHKLFD